MKKTLRKNATIFSLVFPGILIFILATLAPIILSFYYGMTNMTGNSLQFDFIGITNYIQILTKDNIFWVSLLHAFILGIATIVIQHPICILLAIALDKIGNKAEKIFRVLFFVPCVISIMVTSKMWINILSPGYGLLDKLLDMVGLGFAKQTWLGDPKFAIWSIGGIVIWQGFGFGLLVYYSGIKGIPEELYEAGRLDGATGMKLYTKITMPLLAPVMKVAVTMAMIACLKQMETVFLTTNGGPGNSTQFLANYLYTKAFSSFEFGYANAISVIFVIVCMIVTFLTNKLLKDEVSEF